MNIVASNFIVIIITIVTNNMIAWYFFWEFEVLYIT